MLKKCLYIFEQSSTSKNNILGTEALKIFYLDLFTPFGKKRDCNFPSETFLNLLCKRKRNWILLK